MIVGNVLLKILDRGAAENVNAAITCHDQYILRLTFLLTISRTCSCRITVAVMGAPCAHISTALMEVP